MGKLQIVIKYLEDKIDWNLQEATKYANPLERQKGEGYVIVAIALRDVKDALKKALEVDNA